MAAPTETRTPNWHRAKITEECGWKGGDRGGLAEWEQIHGKKKAKVWLDSTGLGRKEVKKGDAGGRPSWRSSLLGDASVEFAMENSGNGKREKKERNDLTLTGLLMEGVVVTRLMRVQARRTFLQVSVGGFGVMSPMEPRSMADRAFVPAVRKCC